MTLASIKIHPFDEEQTENQNDTITYTSKSLCCISIDSSIRQWVLQLVKTSRFDTFLLVMIVLNSVTMALVDYRHVDENYEPLTAGSWRNQTIEIAEVIFLVIFVMESLSKMIAFGFINGKNAYLKDAWNCFDFVIVVLR